MTEHPQTPPQTPNSNGVPASEPPPFPTKDPEELQAQSPEEQRKKMLSRVLFGIAALILAIRFPQSALTIALFVVVLSVLVFVHEWGHFQFARWGGMKVNRFAIGFPPFVYTRYKNGVAYSIGALPIGGMVDIAGLGSEEEMVAEAKGTDLTNAPSRQIGNRSVPHGQRLFQDSSFFWRFMTLFAGPLMNFLFAVALFILIYSVKGLPSGQIAPAISQVSTGLPAQKAGLQPNDVIQSVNGKPVTTFDQVLPLVRANGTKPLALTIKRGEQVINTTVTPVLKDLNNTGKPTPSIGVVFDQTKIINITWQRVPVADAVRFGFLQSIGVVRDILDVIKRAFTANLLPEEVKSVGGPVKIAQVTGQAASFGPWAVLNLAALLSVNLGLMNLLPVPALDGGRILFLFIGSAYQAIARRPIDPRKETLVHLAGMALLLAFMLFITLKDVSSFFTG